MKNIKKQLYLHLKLKKVYDGKRNGGREMEMEIELPFVYDFDHALIRLASDPVNAVDIAEKTVWIPMAEGNLIELQAIGTKANPKFKLVNALDERQIRRVEEIFHFHQSLDEVTSHFSQTDLAPIFKAYEGMPLIRSFSLYGRLMKGIIHQQLNKTFANTLTLRFVERYGQKIDGVWTYPDPVVVAEIPVSALREMQFSERKAEYVIGLSQAIASGELNLHALDQLENDEVIRQLTAYRGVGPWTAQNFLLFGLGRPNLFPVADVGLQNGLKNLWEMDRKPTKEEITARFSDWSPYLSYAALYLWKSTEVK